MGQRLFDVIWAKRFGNFRLQIRSHSHKHYDMFYILGGKAIFEIDGNLYTAEKNDCILIPPDTIHRQCPTDVTTELYEIKFLVNDKAAGDLLKDWPRMKRFHDHGYPEEAIGYVVEHYFYRDERNLTCLDLLLGSVFALGVKDEYSNRAADSKYIQTDSFRRPSRALAVYLENNHTDTFSLKKAAATLGVNPNYLCTAFREDTGYRVTQYLNFVRLKQALYSITYNDFNVTEACEAAGYDNINTFAAAFRKYVGVNPSIYRKYCIAAINAKVLDLSTEPVFSSLHTPLKEQMDSMASLGEKIRRVF